MFQRFDEQVASKMDQANKDTSMEAFATGDAQAAKEDSTAKNVDDDKTDEKANSKFNLKKIEAKKLAEAKMTKK